MNTNKDDRMDALMSAFALLYKQLSLWMKIKIWFRNLLLIIKGY